MLRRLMVAAASGGGGGGTDDFSTNTAADYTLTKDAGTPSFAVTGGQLVITNDAGGNNAVVTHNSVSFADGYVEADIEHMVDGGLYIRFQNQNNAYLASLSDDSGTNPSANIRLFKRVSGTYTQLGSSVNITWARGTPNTIRLAASGTSLVVSLNGVTQISQTDSAISAAGKIGMRGNSSSAGADNKYNALRWG